jgi:hypothetical protein
VIPTFEATGSRVRRRGGRPSASHPAQPIIVAIFTQLVRADSKHSNPRKSSTSYAIRMFANPALALGSLFSVSKWIAGKFPVICGIGRIGRPDECPKAPG